MVMARMLCNGALQICMMETDWESEVLHVMWKISDESPAKRDMYILETSWDIFSLHFCKARLIKEEPVAAQTIQIWPSIAQVVKHWLSFPKV